ncbi:hypothetical protein [Microterricola viridarii]|uniref:Uncharacterized protein n=1 Tax=Microterricola viridarii TaxID=412690 RepID=A0A0X8E1L8_9MICO|nr:hypothetical protein [Microterricola viridarii]AMB58675.1 hypothetical protein AWU67_07150 [Microterricola viridarii]
MLNCEWSSSAGTEGPRLTVEILPDAVGEYFDFVEGLPLADSQLGLIGPDSRINCYADTEGSSCSASFLADGYWVDFEFTRPAADPAPTIEETRSVAVVTGTAIRDSLQAAGEPLPQFQPPADSLAAWDDCGVVDGDGSFRTALGSPSLGEAEARDSEGAIAMFAIAWQRADFLSCDWRQADPYEAPAGELRLLGVNILPGGGWAWPELSEVALSRDGATDVAIEGAEQAVASCIWDDEHSGCTVEALVDGSYLYVDTGYDEAADGSARERAIEAMGILISRLG